MIPRLLAVVLGMLLLTWSAGAAAAAAPTAVFPPPLESYGDAQMTGLVDVLLNRIRRQPFNLWATVLFVGAILHTFLAGRFLHWSHSLAGRRKTLARVCHYLGEVEVVFGIWALPLFALLALQLGWNSAVHYVSHISYIEPVFVVVIMTIASTRPVLRLAEQCLQFFARLGGGGPAAWWMAILTLGPVLGSLITEPAAMTISALLLAKQFYARKPPARLAYATLGLLFVNISVGGVLTHFAAPPVLMVAAPWGWTTPFMLSRFGWAAVLGMVVSNALYYFALRKSFPRPAESGTGEAAAPETPVPGWITGTHLAFMAWTVLCAHYPALLIGGLLFFVAFLEITREHQGELRIRSPILVGFFLAGLVIHGGLQQWWIEPMLSRLTEVPLMLGAAGLTAFNDNAAITYLATLVPNLGPGLKYAVVAGALAGGGLTVIANAPNPAGQAILGRHFQGGITPMGLLLGALPATAIMILCFLLRIPTS